MLGGAACRALENRPNLPSFWFKSRPKPVQKWTRFDLVYSHNWSPVAPSRLASGSSSFSQIRTWKFYSNQGLKYRPAWPVHRCAVPRHGTTHVPCWSGTGTAHAAGTSNLDSNPQTWSGWSSINICRSGLLNQLSLKFCVKEKKEREAQPPLYLLLLQLLFVGFISARIEGFISSRYVLFVFPLSL